MTWRSRIGRSLRITAWRLHRLADRIDPKRYRLIEAGSGRRPPGSRD